MPKRERPSTTPRDQNAKPVLKQMDLEEKNAKRFDSVPSTTPRDQNVPLHRKRKKESKNDIPPAKKRKESKNALPPAKKRKKESKSEIVQHMLQQQVEQKSKNIEYNLSQFLNSK